MRSHPEYQYLNTLQEILDYGERVPNRTGVDTIRLLGVTHRYNFEDGFPLLTTKKVWFKGVAHELLWFLSGSTNIKYLVDNGVNIWNDDAYRHCIGQTTASNPPSKEEWLERLKSGETNLGEIGPVYGKQWRRWQTNTIYKDTVVVKDQVENLVHSLKNNPSSRRHILSAWNVADIELMGLPPCHVMSQYTISNGKLWCHMYQRSCDMFLGVPFNIASYSLLTYMLAHVCGLEPGGFIWTGHDVHCYEPHISAIKEQLQRTPYEFPQLELNSEIKNIDDFKYGDFKIVGYKHHPPIKAPLIT